MKMCSCDHAQWMTTQSLKCTHMNNTLATHIEGLLQSSLNDDPVLTKAVTDLRTQMGPPSELSRSIPVRLCYTDVMMVVSLQTQAVHGEKIRNKCLKQQREHPFKLLGSSGGVVNSLDFCLVSLKSPGCFYFQCILSSQWKVVNLWILHRQL